MAEPWTANLTRGLWGFVQGAVRSGASLADVRAAAAGAGEAPDAATLSHLFSRAVAGGQVQRNEAAYRDTVDRSTYLARRPGRGLITDLPRGFNIAGAYRQVVRVTGADPLTGAPKSLYVNVQFSQLLSRGEAIELALGAIAECSPECLEGELEADYWTTWRAS